MSSLFHTCILLWALGLALAIIVGFGQGYIHGTKRLIFHPVRWCARLFWRGFLFVCSCILTWIGNRFRGW